MRTQGADSKCLNRGLCPFLKVLVPAVLALSVIGCAGTRTFNEYARAGDTVAVPVGWKQNFSPDNITVTITPSTGVPVVYLPDDPAIKGIVNMPVDPLSSMVVSRETGIDQTPHAGLYSSVIQANYTDQDKDWWQTVVFLDLPQALPPGQSTIAIDNPDGESAATSLEIIEGTGQPHSFSAQGLGPMSSVQRQSLMRVDHYTISFSGTDVPDSLQIDLSHDADIDNGGVGRALVVNPVGYIKNTSWSDDGFTTRVLLTPARDSMIGTFKDFKFYVAGGVTNLEVAGLKAFDSAGQPVAGVSASITNND